MKIEIEKYKDYSKLFIIKVNDKKQVDCNGQIILYYDYEVKYVIDKIVSDYFYRLETN